MPERPCEVRIAGPVLLDLSEIWDWTVQQFGFAAALRYEALIEQAISDLADDPQRPGTKPRADVMENLWVYHLAFSRDHMAFDQRVKAPRHFVMFRRLQPSVIEVVRIVHDRRDLARHVPEG